MIHFVNNLERAHDCTDKFYKVRSLMNAILKRCRELEIGEFICIDEQMTPFTGKIGMLQYVQNKPCKWGIKIFVLYDQNGLAYNSIAYQGSTTKIDEHNLKTFGQSSAIVLELLTVLKKKSTKSFLTIILILTLLEQLLKLKVYATRTVRIN